MVISDRTKGCCSSDLNEPPHPDHDQFAELDAHNFCPQSWWLGALVAPLATGNADLVNGYRWLVPKPPTLASVLVAHIDGGEQARRALVVSKRTSLPNQMSANEIDRWAGQIVDGMAEQSRP